jgi:integrase
MSELLLDAAGRRRSPATLPQFHAGRPPRNKGMRYPADPPTIEEIIAVMRRAGDSIHGRRLRGLIVVLWRAGLRIHEALALAEADLDPRRGSLLVRRGKGGRRREVGMDDWAWEQLEPWLQARVQLPVGPLFCVVTGATRGRPWAAAAARSELRRVAREAGVRRRFAPHQLRHAHAVEMAREGVPLIVIQRQLGHTNLGITSWNRCAKTAPLLRSRSLTLRSCSSSAASVVGASAETPRSLGFRHFRRGRPYAVGRTAPPSAEIEEQINRLLVDQGGGRAVRLQAVLRATRRRCAPNRFGRW